ncbi:MAG: hypothetical protein WAX69_15805 [Victivallales bacterium]
MKKFLSVMIVLTDFVLGAEELPTLFDRALNAQGKTYGIEKEDGYNTIRAKILATDAVVLKEFLNAKTADPKSSVLEKALAHVLIEHIDKKKGKC